MSAKAASPVATQAPAAPTVSGWRVQRSCACGQQTVAGGECESCRKKREGELQRSAAGSGAGGVAPPIVHDVLATAGRPLDAATRGFMEPRFALDLSRVPSRPPQGPSRASLVVDPVESPLEREAEQAAARVTRTPASQPSAPAAPAGRDFRGVRIHDDERAAQSAAAIGARAYTVGEHIVFGAAQYQPHTAEGRRLLAHELAHVVQQGASPRGAHRLSRQRCGHDGKPAKCVRGSSGIFKLIDQTDQSFELFPIDGVVVEEGLKNLGGNWARQVRCPANPVKSGADRGFIDGVKVTESASLGVEVVEVKSRSKEGGGCERATREVNGYVGVLKAIAGKVADISQKLAAKGGLRVPSEKCKYPNAKQKAILKEAGVDVDGGDQDAIEAWCFYNSLQDGLGKTFTKGFASVDIKANADGTPDTTYRAGPPLNIDCPNKGGLGLRMLVFQVNQHGGVSYGCFDECPPRKKKEKEKQKEKEKEKEEPVAKDLKLQDDQPVIGDRPAKEGDKPVDLPPGGINDVELILLSAATLRTVAFLHKAATTLKGKELEAARKTALEVIERAEAKGALELGSKLNSSKVAKLGTDAYKPVLEAGEEGLEIAAKQSPRFLARFGPKAARGLGRVAAILGIVLLAKDAAAAVDHVSKGGTIEFGFSMDEKELEGQTKVDVHGGGGQDVPGDVKLKDTTIDLDVQGIPSVSGRVEIEAEKLTVRGAATEEGAPVTLNIKAHYKNSTIILKHTGHMRNGKVVIDDATEISDSEIEIDLPPDAVDPGTRKSGETKTITGAKVKVTSVGPGGGGGAGGAAGGAGGGGGGTTPPAGPQSTTPGQQQTPPAGTGTGTPGATQPAAPDRQALRRQVEADPVVNAVYTKLLGEGGVVPTPEFLQGLLNLKGLMRRHPKEVEAFLKTLTPGTITDQVKQILEPLEQALAKEDAKLEKTREQAIESAVKKAKQQGTPVGTPTQPKPEGTAGDQPGPKPEDKPAPESGKGGAPGKTPEGTPKPAPPAGTTPPAARPDREVQTVPFVAVYYSLKLPLLLEPTDAPPPSLTFSVDWSIGSGSATLFYKVPLTIKFVGNLPPEGKEKWRASYLLSAPSGVILDTDGDWPVQISGPDINVILSHSPVKK